MSNPTTSAVAPVTESAGGPRGTFALSASEANAAARPLVSIGMPLYNEARTVAVAIEAILAQDYTNFELIISDNASTDDTPRICREHAERDSRIRFACNKTNEGSLPNFNKVFQRSRGEFFAWAGGHDRWEPQFLSRCLEPLLADENVVLVHPRVLFLNAEGREVGRNLGGLDTRDYLHRLNRFNIVLWSLVYCFEIYGLIRSSAMKQTSLFSVSHAPDFVMMLELALLGTFAHVPEPLLYAREPTKDIGVTFQKCFNQSPSRFALERMYWTFLLRCMSVVFKHVRSWRGKVIGVMIISIYNMVNHENVSQRIRSRVASPR